MTESIAYRPRRELRHDDGRFAAYRRHFSASVPFVVLARDKTAVANRLDLEPFVVSMTRRRSEEAGRDVTDEIADILTDRIPELLAIVVHHSLGTQTLELMSQTFEERARRLRSLRVRHVENLIVDARVEGTDMVTTLGEGLNQDIFLEGPTSSAPILFHDFSGENWKDHVRRRLAPHLAAILENAAYTATLALFLLADGDAAREGALQELGITATDVENIRSQLGAVTSGDRDRHHRWFSAVLSVRTGLQADPTRDPEALHAHLRDSGFTDEDASRLIHLGGGTGVRGDASPQGSLWLLESKGFDLRALDTKLKLLGDEGLDIRVARTRLRQWVDANGRRAAAVLALRQSPERAKAEVSTWKAPAHLTFSLDPPMEELLAPIVSSLRALGYAPNRDRLATEPTAELVRLAERTSVSELDALVTPLYDAEERQRMLRSAAAAWRRELLVLSVLSRVGPHDLRATIRDSANAVEHLLPTNPIAPTVFEPVLDPLFPRHLAFASALKNVVVDSLIASVPDRHELIDLASTNGVAVGHLEAVIRAIEAPRREAAKRTRERVLKLKESNLTVKPPVGMHAPAPKPPGGKPGRKRVAAIKVDERVDRRKRQLGDEGERWALAATIEPFLNMTAVERREAVQAILSLLEQFDGDSVEAARAHAEPVCVHDLDDEELIDELTAFLHVSQYSDGFGFDLLGWLPTSADATPSALCLEVKSSGDGTVHLSTSEWSLASRFHNNEMEGSYAVLVIKRSATGGSPVSLDLLVDPLFLEASGLLQKSDDGYKLMYRSE